MSEYREARRARKASQAKAKTNHRSAAGEAAAAYRQAVQHEQRRGAYYLWAAGGALALWVIYMVCRAAMDHSMGVGGTWRYPGGGQGQEVGALHLILFLILLGILMFWLTYCRTRFGYWPRLARQRSWRYLLRMGVGPLDMASAARSQIAHAPTAPLRFLISLTFFSSCRLPVVFFNAAGAILVTIPAAILVMSRLGAAGLLAIPFCAVDAYILLTLRMWMPVPPKRKKDESGARSQDQLAQALNEDEGEDEDDE